MSPEELEDVNNHQLISYTKKFIREALMLTDQTPIAERTNIIGHLYNGLKECDKKGLTEEVLEDLNQTQRHIIFSFMKNNNLLE
jgi:hypothetical protein